MNKVAVGVGLAAIFALGAFVGPHLYRRSLPATPVVIPQNANLGSTFRTSLTARLKAILGHSDIPAGSRPKLIALTFDDGPYPVDTPQLLATLRAAQVHATFFLIGRDAEQFPSSVRAILADGNEIGNHTETHPNLDQLDDAAVTAELQAAATSLSRLAGRPIATQLFRPPHGRYLPATIAAAQRAGFATILWNDDPGDWRQVGAATIAAHVARFATAPEILLLHSGRPETVAMLPAIIARYRAAGYTFVTVGEMLRAVPPEQLNHPARMPLPPA